MTTQKLRWKKRKYFIRINCWIMMLILLVVLLFMGFPIVSHAESAYTYDDTLPAHLGISDTDILVPRNITQEEGYCYLMADDDKLVYFDDDLTNGAIIWDSSIDDYEYNVSHGDWSSTYTVADAECYRAYFSSNNSFVIEFYMTELSRYVTFQENDNNSSKTSMCYIGPYGYNDSSWDFPIHNYKITVSFSRNSTDNNFYVASYSGVRGAQAFTSNQRYYDSDLCYYGVYGQVYILGNIDAVALPIEPYLKRASYHVDPNDNNSDWVTDWVNASGVSYNPNYSDPEIFTDGSGGDPYNNLYMRSADWKFNIPKYWGNVTSVSVQPQYESSWGNGSIMFYGLINDFQSANAEDFNFNFNFHIWCSGHYFSDVNSDVNGNFYGSFNYNDDSVSLSDFINDNNTKIWSVSDIFSYSVNSNGDDFSTWLNDNVKGHNSINNWNWYITCDASLVASNSSSGHIVEKYDFISQVSTEQSNNITTNNNPYIPPTDSGFDPGINTNNPDNGTTTTSSNGNITINNNPTFNNNNGNSNMNTINNGNGNPFNTLIDKLFGDGTVQEGSIGDNTQNKLLTTTGASRWLAVINDSMSWIPAAVWAEIMMFLGITLGILVVAFILRIILDFL